MAYLIAIVALANLGSATAIHPFHTTTADARVDPETGQLQVALQVDPEDLQGALDQFAKRVVDLENADEVGRVAPLYISQRWRFTAPDQEEPFPLQWVGYEIEVTSAWLYFQVALPKPTGLDGLEVSHRVFFELNDEQINTVRFRQGDYKRSLRFSKQQPVHKLVVGPRQ